MRGLTRGNSSTGRALLLALVVAVAALALASGSSASSSRGGSASPPLTVNGGYDGAITDNFNPFLPTSAAVNLALTTFIYEPLIQYDGASSTKTYPWLAKSATWSNDDKTLTLDLRPGVKWSDGQPFTSADVAFTFDELKSHPSLNVNGITFQSIKTEGPHKAVMTFSAPSYPEYFPILGETYMVPKHLWAKVNPITFTNTKPVGTGPYVFSSYSSQGVILKKNPHYWQPGLPKVQELSFPVYNNNDSAAVALENGDVQWSGQYIPGIQKVFVAKSPQNHIWQPGGSVNSLVPNLTVYPLSLLPVRKAMSLALDRQQISALGENAQEPPVVNETGVILPAEKSFLDPALAHDSFNQNVTKAKSILKAAGFKWSSSGQLMSPKGTPVELTLEDPTAFTDFIADDQQIANQLKAIGMKVTVQGVAVNTWNSDLDTGKFQLSVDFGNGGSTPPTPYYVYTGILNASLTAPIGKAATGDFERWNDPGTKAAFKAYANASSAAGRQKALDQLEGILANKLPVIPILYAANWAQYTTKNYVGWPTPSNPYQIATPNVPTSEVVILHLKPR